MARTSRRINSGRRACASRVPAAHTTMSEAFARKGSDMEVGEWDSVGYGANVWVGVTFGECHPDLDVGGPFD